jgi:universal bacterial protein YeaZ
MNILAIESTGKTAAIAIGNEEKILADINLNCGYTHSQTLLPMINDLLKMLNIAQNEIDYVACSSGPGSFTGIKIGVASAKAFAHAFNIPIINVPTLDAMALNIFAPGSIIVPIMDARRSQVYTAIYECKKDGPCKISDYLNCSIEEIIERSLSFEKDVIFLGDGVIPNKDKINAANIFIASENLNLQSVRSVIYCAKKMLLDPKNIFSYENFSPFYLRKPQAQMTSNN